MTHTLSVLSTALLSFATLTPIASAAAPPPAQTQQDSPRDATTCTQISRTEERARQGIIDGTLCRTPSTSEGREFRLTLPSENFEQTYRVKGGLCFGAVTVSGCGYEPSGWLNRIGISEGFTRRCSGPDVTEHRTTTTIGSVSFYRIETVSGTCRFF